MATLDEVKSYEGRNILVLPKNELAKNELVYTGNELVYTGIISNVRKPTPEEIKRGAVAITHFNYKCIHQRSDGTRIISKSDAVYFPFRKTDVLCDIEPYEIDFIPSPITLQ